MRRREAALAGLAVGAGLWAMSLGWWHLTGRHTPLDRIEAPLADGRLLLAGRQVAPREVVIVAIDDATVSAEKGYPIPRVTLARLIRAISAAKPRAIAVDLLLIDETAPDTDRQLAEALELGSTVIAAAGQFDRRAGENAAGMPRTSKVLWPAKPFDGVADVGLVNIVTDSGGTPRHLPLLFQTDRGLTPSFVLRAATLGSADPDFALNKVQLAGTSVRVDLGYHLPLRFYGPRGTIETISASSLLSGTTPAQQLEHRIAVIGVTATGVGDTFATPFDPVLPGVEVLATGIARLADGDSLVRDASIRKLDAAATVLLAVGAVLVISLAPVSAALAVVAVGVGLWLAVTTVLFGQGYWLSAALPLAGVLPPVIAAIIFRQLSDRRQTRDIARAEAALRQFQSPVLAERIAREPDFLREPVEQMLATLFVDLSGFTLLSEQLGPTLTREFLQQFHAIVEKETMAREGLVTNFLGDGAMIVFGIPEVRGDDASRAFDTAWRLIDEVHAWIDRSGMAGRIKGVRVGGHFGPVVVSRLGHESHQHIAATGDSVNVASRLLDVAKEYGATLSLTEDFLKAVAQAATPRRKPDEVRDVELRGRRQHVVVALWRKAGAE